MSMARPEKSNLQPPAAGSPFVEGCPPGSKYDSGKQRWWEILPWDAVQRVVQARPAEPEDVLPLLCAYRLGDRSALPRIGCWILSGNVNVHSLALVVDVLEFGARKYDLDNWQQVENARQRYFDAMCRHIAADVGPLSRQDPDSHLPHWAHALCCILFTIWFDIQEEQNAETSPISASAR